MGNDKKWENSIWFFDIDDTLIDTANTSVEASLGIRDVFARYFDEETGKRVQVLFNQLFQSMMAGYRVKAEEDWKDCMVSKTDFEKILEDIENRQTVIKSKYGAIKKWSREVLIKIAADRLEIDTNPTIIKEAADAYWLDLTKMTMVFPDALKLLSKIKEKNRPIFFITSSDARLEMREDGQFEYIPEHSEKLKRERIELLKEKGVKFDLVSIGDPEDKPHRDFFEKGLLLAEEYLGCKIETQNCIMTGDSFAGDLETPLRMLGFGMVVLYDKNNDGLRVEEDKFISTNNLAEVINLFEK